SARRRSPARASSCAAPTRRPAGTTAGCSSGPATAPPSVVAKHRVVSHSTRSTADGGGGAGVLRPYCVTLVVTAALPDRPPSSATRNLQSHLDAGERRTAHVGGRELVDRVERGVERRARAVGSWRLCRLVELSRASALCSQLGDLI